MTICWGPHPSRHCRRWRVFSCGDSNYPIGRTWGRRGGTGTVSRQSESSGASSACSSRRRPSCTVDTCNIIRQLTITLLIRLIWTHSTFNIIIHRSFLPTRDLFKGILLHNKDTTALVFWRTPSFLPFWETQEKVTCTASLRCACACAWWRC